MEIPLTGDVSETPEALAAKIDASIAQDLGLPVPPVKDAGDDNAGDANEENTEGDAAGVDNNQSDDSGGSDAAERASDEGTESEEEANRQDDNQQVAATVPSDDELFIEVEDAEGTVHKISRIEDLPEDIQLKNDRQGLEIMRALDKLDVKIAARDTEQAAAAERAEVQKVEKAQYQSWDNEVNELIKEGRLEKAAVDPDDPAYADDPTVKRIDAVFKFMNETNVARSKAGNPNFITSFQDALNLVEAQEARQAAEDAKKRDADTAKQKSGLIGGSGSGGGSSARVYVSGSAKHMDDVPL